MTGWRYGATGRCRSESCPRIEEEHPSRPRNPLIADAFYRRGLIERWGRGTQKIVELCVRAGHPEPEFGQQASAFWVRFLPSGYIAPHRIGLDLSARQRLVLQLLSGADRMASERSANACRAHRRIGR